MEAFTRHMHKHIAEFLPPEITIDNYMQFQIISQGELVIVKCRPREDMWVISAGWATKCDMRVNFHNVLNFY